MILVTGGAGYIGSQCALLLLANNYDVLVIDDLSTGHMEIISKIKEFGDVLFFNIKLSDKEALSKIFSEYNIDSVIHFAASSQVAESCINPKKYYVNNVFNSINLFNVMLSHNVNKLIFSSTAAIYGEPNYNPVDENHPKNPINPYGKSKLMIENILDDYDKAYNFKSVRLRYFNVAGADSDCRVGPWHEPETSLIPNILKSSFASEKEFKIFGNDYPTKDGTCIRDYIDIEDLAQAHILALECLLNGGGTNYFNLGTAQGYSVKEIFDECERVIGKKIKYTYAPRRLGDPASVTADSSKAEKILGWKARSDIKKTIKNAYAWECSLRERYKSE